MDVNEEIVKEWIHSCKQQFTIDDLQFKVYGSKGGSNYSNIDILAVDKSGNYYAYEIKWRSRFTISKSNKNKIKKFLSQLIRKERNAKIKSIIGNRKINHVLVTTHQLLGRSREKREYMEKQFIKRGITIVYFEDIFRELIQKIEVNGRYNSPVMQTIRILKYFKLIKNSKD
ncbi:MAG: hypothetical protein QXE90_02025 [Candidatus Micrarchaeia archaeon]